CVGFAALAGLFLLVAKIGAGASLIQDGPSHGRDHQATGKLDDGQRDAEELEDGRAQYLEHAEENDVTERDAARQRVQDVGRRFADQPKKDQGGPKRVDDRQQYTERDEKDLPERQESSPLGG